MAPDIRAEVDDERAAGYVEPPAAAATDLFEPKRRRSRVLTYVAVLAVVALVAGFGVLALTFHAATTLTADGPAVATDPQTEIADLQKQIDALANSSGPGSEETRAKIAELEARLADIEAAKAPAAAAPAAPVVRTISTDGAPADETPPSPRERPARARSRCRAGAGCREASRDGAGGAGHLGRQDPRLPRRAEAGGARCASQGRWRGDRRRLHRQHRKSAGRCSARSAAGGKPPRGRPRPQRRGSAPRRRGFRWDRPAPLPPTALPNDIGPAIGVVPRAGLPADAASADATPARW